MELIDEGVQKWSIEKVLACLKHIVHPEMLPPISQEELHRMKYTEELVDDEKVLEFLKLMYRKSKGKLDIYGNVNDMFENIQKVERVPELIVFSSNEEAKMSRICASLALCYGYKDTSETFSYHPRSSLWITTFQCFTNRNTSSRLTDIINTFYFCWLTAYLNKLLRGAKGTFDLVPTDSHLQLNEALSIFCHSEQNITIPKESVTIESFSKLRRFFDQKDEKLFNQALAKITVEEIARSQEIAKKCLAEITFLIENTRKIFNQHIELFIPFSKLPTPLAHRMPVIRLIFGETCQIFLAREVKEALEIMMTNRMAKYQFFQILEFTNFDIILETEEERRLGIVHAIEFDALPKKFAKFNVKMEDFIILQAPYEVDFRKIAFPIMSAYGTHCIPAVDAFDNIIYYLTVILKVFQRSKSENLQKVFDWIQNIAKKLFVKKDVIYLIEISKIDEIIDRAREELSPLLTEPEYNVPVKENYDKAGVLHELEKLTSNLGTFFSEKASEIIEPMLKKQITIKNIYHGYSQLVRYFLQDKFENLNSFIVTQMALINSESSVVPAENEPKPESKPKPKAEKNTFSGFKRGFLNRSAALPKKQEPKKEVENLPSCSTENAGNRGQKQLEELVSDSLKKEMLQLQEELKKSQTSKAQQEEELKLQLNTVRAGFEDQVRKVQEDLEKSQEEKSRLEEQLKTLEISHQKDIKNLNEVQEKKIILLNENLEKEKAENIDLKNEHRRNCEELKQRIDILTSENQNLEAKNTKNIEFQDNIRELSKTLKDAHCDLVDISWDRLHSLCSIYPESGNMKEAKIDVRKMEDCLDEYVENVKNEFEKLAQ